MSERVVNSSGCYFFNTFRLTQSFWYVSGIPIKSSNISGENRHAVLI